MSNEQETKLCKHCQSEIPKKAKVCPNCRKKQGGILKWIILAVIVLVLAGACAGGGDDEKASDAKPQKVGETSKTEQSEEQQTETPAEEKVDNEFSIGEIVETSSLRISYVSAEEYVSDNEFIQPKDGHMYYKMDFEFENISDSDQYVSSWDFNCYADGYDMEQSYILEGLDLDATLSPGKKTKGAVVFEVPEGAESIVLEYETNFWTENKIVFVVK